MTDVVSAPVRIPATRITEDVQTVIDSAPYQPVDWDALTISSRLDEATKTQLLAMAKQVI